MKPIASRLAWPTLLSLAIAAMAGAHAGTPTGTSGSTGSTAGSGTSTTDPGRSGAANQPADRGSKLARADAGFLRQAAQNGLAELESGKLALTKATHSQVKSFAQQMVDDHTKANEELKALATSKGVEMPTEPSLMQRAKMKLLETADGESFDRRYAEGMGVDAHEDTLKLFQKAASSATDTDVKAFAAKTVATLQQHMQMAQDLKAAIDSSTSASGTSGAPGSERSPAADARSGSKDAYGVKEGEAGKSGSKY